MNLVIASIIIPSFNRPAQTLRSVVSALSQSAKGVEVIVVDDNGEGSQKQLETERELCQFIDQKKIKYIKHEKNKGGNASRNTGVRHSSGIFVALLDSDDEFLPNKLEKQLAYILQQRDKSIKAVTCGRINVKNGKTFRIDQFEAQGDFSFELLSLGLSLGAGSTLLVEREVVEKIGLFNEDLTRHQEVEMLLRFFRQGYKLKVLPNPLVKIHIDDRSNIPKPDLFIRNKKLYLKLVEGDIQRFPRTQQRIIYCAHNLEIAKNCIRHKQYMRSLLFIILAKPSLRTLLGLLGSIFCYAKRIIQTTNSINGLVAEIREKKK